MSPDIFIEDFERTDNTDFLHGVLGRVLILATRFDFMCNSLALLLHISEFRTAFGIAEQSFRELVDDALSRYRTLYRNIESIGLPDQLADELHRARKARNEIAHSLTVRLTGCLDTKINKVTFIQDVERLVRDLVIGDIIISLLISTFNHEPLPNKEFFNSYEGKVLDWVKREYYS